MKKIFNYVVLLAKYEKLKKETEKKDKRIEDLENENKILVENQEFLFNENTVLKQINRKRYVKQEDKMQFLTNREKDLTKIQEMVKNGDKWNEIKKYIKNL